MGANETDGTPGAGIRQLAIIDEIYELRDRVGEELTVLRSLDQRVSVDIVEWDGLRDAVEFLEGQQFGSRLGLSEMDLSKFRRYRGYVASSTLVKLGDRVLSLLREIEGDVSAKEDSILIPFNLNNAEKYSEIGDSNNHIVIRAEKWVVVHKKNAELIANISSLLDEALYLAKANNLPADLSALTDLERAQLIALLETALQLLKAPLVEKGFLKKVAEAAKDGSKNAVQKKSEVALGYALGKLGEHLLKLLGYL